MLLSSLNILIIPKLRFCRNFPCYLRNNYILYASCYSTLKNLSRENFLPFETMVENRRREARKSVVIEVQKEDFGDSLQSICSSFGKIKNMFEFKTKNSKKKSNWSDGLINMYIIEFEEESSLKDIIEAAHINSFKDSETVVFPFLKVVDPRVVKEPSESLENAVPINTAKENCFEKIFYHLRHNCQNMSEQIQYFYDQQKMTEIGWRLRFLTCRKIEWVLPRVLSHIKVLPFGSSVNTFGNNDCDLDMIVDFSKSNENKKEIDFPLIIQPGRERNASRASIQKHLEMIADLMTFYLPGFSHVVRLLHAFVPIIKCNENFTGMECDITVSNISGYYMSELLYIYGCSDPRVRPLVFSVRWWAKERELSRKMQPGRWFSNFTMSLLVLFFLMNSKSSPVIPPLKVFQELSDSPFTKEGVTYNFVRDATLLPVSSNIQTLEELLEEFFEFYINYDFRKKALSIVTGESFNKPNFSALYIQNPVERDLNVSKNVNLEELETFKAECAVAYHTLRERKDKDTNEDNPWGLLSLVTKEKNSLASSKSKKSLDFDIKSVLNDTDKTQPPPRTVPRVNIRQKSKGGGEVVDSMKNSIANRRAGLYNLVPSKNIKKKNRNLSNRSYPPTFKF